MTLIRILISIIIGKQPNSFNRHCESGSMRDWGGIKDWGGVDN